jgi:DedD protein
MDQALKARLIGAAVLVALAVLLIPELLSGRKPDGAEGGVPSATHGTRTFTIELAGGGAPATTPATTPAPAPAAAALAGVAPAQAGSAPPEATAQAGPAAPAGDSAGRAQLTAGPAAPGTASEAAPQSSAPPSAAGSQGQAATTKQSIPAPMPPAASRPASGGWAVQVGAFGSAATAEKMVDQLKSAGYRAYISPVSRSGKSLNRVRVGPEAERARAEGLAASLKARGLPATVVANE